jgi:hypothetical protein
VAVGTEEETAGPEATNLQRFIKMKFIKYQMLLLFIMLSAGNIFPQFSLSTKIDGYYDDNIYNNYTKVSDFIKSFSLGSAYDFESESNNFQLYYMGNFSYYNQYNFKSSNSHKIGAVNTYLFSKEDNPLNIGMNFSIRNNKDDFTIYDNNLISAYGNYRQTTSENNYLLLGYLFNRINYKNFSVFSYNENKGFIKFNSAFKTETSMMLGVEIDNKNYIEKYNDPSLANNTTQLNGFIQLSQIIGESTGLSGYFLKRYNLTTGTRYVYSDEFVFYEEEIFNDVYSNDGYEAGISFSQLVGSSLMLSLEATYIKRNFSALPIAGVDGYSMDILREDNQLGLGIGLQADLSFIFNDLIGSLKWNYLKNNSNDYYYNFDNQIMSAGLEWGI